LLGLGGDNCGGSCDGTVIGRLFGDDGLGLIVGFLFLLELGEVFLDEGLEVGSEEDGVFVFLEVYEVDEVSEETAMGTRCRKYGLDAMAWLLERSVMSLESLRSFDSSTVASFYE
jgi:hypothetical protein